MNTDQLRARFPDESACRQFFESIIWKNGRVCPIALAKSPTTFVEKPRGQDSMNVTSVNDNLQLPPVLRCIAQSCLYGNGCR